MKVDPTLVQRILAGLAREKDLASAPLEEVQAIKRDNSVVHYRFIEREVKKPADRTFEHCASTDHVDGMADIIEAGGWDLLRMKTGKVPLLWSHDSTPGTMGLVDAAKKNVKLDDGHRALVTTSRVFEPEVFQGSEWGKHVATISALMERGDMPGVSVGFIPKSFRFASQAEQEKDPEMRPWSCIYDGAELLELSVTPIPANPYAQERKSLDRVLGALRSLVNEGKLDAGMAELYVKALESSERGWLERAGGKARTVVPITELLPWLRVPEKAADAPREDDAEVRVLRREFASATASMIQATTELRAARAALQDNSKTHDRVCAGAGSQPPPEGAGAAASTTPVTAGTGREAVTDEGASDLVSRAVKAALQKRVQPEHTPCPPRSSPTPS